MIIRLVGIDEPDVSHKKREPGQPYGQQATKYLAKLVLNKNVEIKEYSHDRYGRSLALVYVNGKNVKLKIVEDGFAEVYRGRHAPGFDPARYLEAEKQAKEAKKGHVGAREQARESEGVAEEKPPIRKGV